MFDFAQDSMMPESTQSWLTAINGHSLMENGTMTSLIKANGQCVERVTRIGEQADFYRNLNSPGFYSCKQRKGANRGKVSGYANIFVVSNPSFVVSLAGRRRTLRERKRCVHAYVRGNVYGLADVHGCGGIVFEGLICARVRFPLVPTGAVMCFMSLPCPNTRLAREFDRHCH